MRLLLPFLLLFSLNAGANFGSEALSYLNSIRAKLSLSKLTRNSYLDKAAREHARYCILNQYSGHNEKQNAKSFFGSSPSQRAIRAHYESRMVSENVASNIKEPKKVIDGLLGAIYHRFGFLDFDIDEIGIGRFKKGAQISSVFDMGNKKIGMLCQKEHTIKPGSYYTTNVCRDPKQKLPYKQFRQAKEGYREFAPELLLYPKPNQKDLPLAFYEETPDPLPDYDVSGFPITIELNPRSFKGAQVVDFELQDQEGEAIESRLLTVDTDPNKKLNERQFALMPLKRLHYNTQYRCCFEAVSFDNRAISKCWHFKTKQAPLPLFTINQKHQKIEIGDLDQFMLYFEPQGPHDIFRGISYRGEIEISYIDPNTIKVTRSHTNRLKGKNSIKAMGRVVEF